MTVVQLFSLVIFAIWPIELAAAFWFFELPKRQRAALAQFAPIAAKLMMKQKDSTLSYEARLQLATAFVAEAFKASHLPHYSVQIVQAAIEAAL
jgi:hypothetical protein